MSSETNLELGTMVFDASVIGNKFVEAFDDLLATSDDTFELDRSTIEALRQVLGTNTLLAVKLYEQNQELGDMAEAAAKKYNIPFEK